jgi:RPA family protein
MADKDEYASLTKEEVISKLEEAKRAIETLGQEVQRERAAKEAAQEAARIAGEAAQTSASSNRTAADANFPWCVNTHACLPYLKMRCKEQHLFVSNRLV